MQFGVYFKGRLSLYFESKPHDKIPRDIIPRPRLFLLDRKDFWENLLVSAFVVMRAHHITWCASRVSIGRFKTLHRVWTAIFSRCFSPPDWFSKIESLKVFFCESIRYKSSKVLHWEGIEKSSENGSCKGASGEKYSSCSAMQVSTYEQIKC